MNKRIPKDLDNNIISQCIFEHNKKKNSHWIHIAINTDRRKKATGRITPEFLTKRIGKKGYPPYKNRNDLKNL